MGFPILFNWVMQIEPPLELEVGRSYKFKKSKNRVFPLDTPIDLIDLERQAIAKIKIVSFANANDETTGMFEILKIYTDTEKEVLSNYWIENQ